MSLIKEVATYRGVVVDKAVSATKNGYPQLVMSLQAVELYDPDVDEWIELAEDDGNEITAFLVLFGKNGEATLSAKQVMKVTGWDGNSLQELDELEVGDPIQFRTKENTYEGNTSIQVAWIDVYDAEPGSTIRRLDKDELKKLDAKYSTGLRKLGGGPKPKSVPKTPAKEKTPPKKKVPSKKAEEEKPLDIEKAWEICNQRKPEGVDEKQLTDAWLEVTEAMGTDEQITAENKWGEACHQVLSKIGVEDDVPF